MALVPGQDDDHVRWLRFFVQYQPVSGQESARRREAQKKNGRTQSPVFQWTARRRGNNLLNRQLPFPGKKTSGNSIPRKYLGGTRDIRLLSRITAEYHDLL